MRGLWNVLVKAGLLRKPSGLGRQRLIAYGRPRSLTRTKRARSTRIVQETWYTPRGRAEATERRWSRYVWIQLAVSTAVLLALWSRAWWGG